MLYYNKAKDLQQYKEEDIEYANILGYIGCIFMKKDTQNIQ